MAINCDPYAQKMYQLAMNLASEDGVKNLDDVVTRMQVLIPGVSREGLVDLVIEAHSSTQKTTQGVLDVLQAVRKEMGQDAALRKQITELEAYLKSGKLPRKNRKKGAAPPDAIAELRAIRNQLKKHLHISKPAVRERLEKNINRLQERIRTGEIAPKTREDHITGDAELERLEYQRNRLAKEIRQEQRALEPRGLWSTAEDVAGVVRAIKTSYDLSGLLRQGGFIAIAHPVRGARAVPAMLAAFSSDEKAYKINDKILNRRNAPLYAKAKLYLAPLEGASMNKREEAYSSRMLPTLEKFLPGLAGSERAYITVLNKLRADSFDSMVDALGGPAGVTKEQAQAIANYVNIATGRGDLGKFAGAAEALNTVFFAARFTTSRFQLLTMNPLRKGSGIRKQVAAEYVRYGLGLSTIISLGVLAGADWEWDTRSSDFGKLRIGNTRLDLLSGMAQTATIITRTFVGQTKSSSTGAVTNLRGPDRKYGRDGPYQTAARFLRTKFSPAASFAVDVFWEQKNVVGDEIMRDEEGNLDAWVASKYLMSQFAPLALSDLLDVAEEQGVAKGVALNAVALLGIGMQTYGEHISTISDAELQAMYRKTVYKDTEQNRKLGRVGFPTKSGRELYAAVKKEKERRAKERKSSQ